MKNTNKKSLEQELNFFYENYLINNARKNSLRQISEILSSGKEYTEMVELGTLGCTVEGCSTLLFSMLAKHLNFNFDSVDRLQNMLDFCKNYLIEYDEENYKSVNLVHMDQYEYLRTRKKKIDFLYIDGSDGAKHLVLDYVVNKIDILNDGAIILVDDTNNNGGAGETCGVINVVNSCKKLNPIDKIQYYEDLCGEEILHNQQYINYPCENNFLVHKNGVRQHVFQIILQYN